jgi:hypothetical protein
MVPTSVVNDRSLNMPRAAETGRALSPPEEVAVTESRVRGQTSVGDVAAVFARWVVGGLFIYMGFKRRYTRSNS